MSRTKPRRQKGLRRRDSDGRHIVIAAMIVLSLFESWTLLAHSGASDTLFRQKGNQFATMSTQSFNSNNILKDYDIDMSPLYNGFALIMRCV